MSQRTNQDVIRIVKKWQAIGLVHELTCRVDGLHAALEPVERGGKVVLVCPTCKVTQEDIPELVLNAEAALDSYVGMKTRVEVRRRARQDVWWMVALVVISFVCFGGIWGGGLYALIGLVVGPIVAFVWARRKLKKIGA